VFDLDAYREAHQPFSFAAGGRRYYARHVSAGQMSAYFRAAETGDIAVIEKALRALLRTAFPWRPSFIWRGDPVDLILRRLPPDERRAVMTDFFGFLGVIAKAATPPRMTPGNLLPS
jgi:hypothetical protein